MKSRIRILTVFLIIAAVLSCLAGCGEEVSEQQGQTPAVTPQVDYSLTVQQRVEQAMASMTLEQKIGQMILVRGDTMELPQLTELISSIGAGGVVLFKPNFADKTEQQVIEMTSLLQSAGGGRLFICVDEEGGTVVRASSNSNLRAEKFKSPQDIFAAGGFDAIIADTAEKCEFLKRLGVNVNFAPVADVVTDPDGFLFSRSFGQDASQTALYVESVVKTMKEHSVGCSIKHFPGYGNSHGDTHQGLVVSSVSAQTLSADLIPFNSGIAAGADSVMVSHTVVDALDPTMPASLSPAVMSYLRNDLAFGGVIVTDGLDMGAITQFCQGSDPCVAAAAAGADLMCIPADPAASYYAMLAAAADGRLSAERIDDAVARILTWKANLGLL